MSQVVLLTIFWWGADDGTRFDEADAIPRWLVVNMVTHASASVHVASSTIAFGRL